METKSNHMRHESADRWSLLPHDLLEKILEKLCFSYCLRAVSTCKNWNMVPVPAISKSLPWMIEQDWSVVMRGSSNGRRHQYCLCCKLNLHEVLNPKGYQPIYRTFDLLGLLSTPPATGGSFGLFKVAGPAEVEDSKLGWVLVKIRIMNISGRRSSSKLLVLFSPFVQDHNDQFRFLPTSDLRMLRKAVFTRPPTSSPSCVVYLITGTFRGDHGSTSLNIHSWKWCNDQMNWKVASHNNILPNQMLHSSAAMEDGTLYCLGQNIGGSLVAYKYSYNSTQVLKISSEAPAVDLVGRVVLNAVLAERDGELFLLCFCGSVKSWWCRMIYWYDTSADRWVLKQRWDDDHQEWSSAFINSAGLVSSSSSASLAAIRVGIDNYVWRRSGTHGLMFYSFQEGKPAAQVGAKEIFPSYHGDCSDKVRFLSMGPSLA